MKKEKLLRYREVKRLRSQGHCFLSIAKKLKISSARAALIYNLGKKHGV